MDGSLDWMTTIEDYDKALAHLRKKRALLSVVQGEESADWAREEVLSLVAQLDPDQLRMLTGLLQLLTGNTSQQVQVHAPVGRTGNSALPTTPE